MIPFFVSCITEIICKCLSTFKQNLSSMCYLEVMTVGPSAPVSGIVSTWLDPGWFPNGTDEGLFTTIIIAVETSPLPPTDLIPLTVKSVSR